MPLRNNIIIILGILTVRSFCSNFSVVINLEGVKKRNICNLQYMKSLMPDLETKNTRVAWQADEDLLSKCPNNTFTCCTSEEMEPLLRHFQYTRELMLFKNQLLEKLFSFLNSVARESFEGFKASFNQEEIQCAGQREYRRLGTYYKFIVVNSAEVNRILKNNTNRLLELYSSFICASCSPINELVFSYNKQREEPVVNLNKRTCQTIVELSYERQILNVMWNRINKIINAIKCKGGVFNEMVLETFQEVRDSYQVHEKCLKEDYLFVNDPVCSQLCKEKLRFFHFTDFRLYRIQFSLETLHQTFNIKSKKDEALINLLSEEEIKHPNSEVKEHIKKIDLIRDR